MKLLNVFNQGNCHFLVYATLGIMALGCGGGGSETAAPTTSTPTPTPSITPTGTIDEQFGLWLKDLSHNVILPGYQKLNTTANSFSHDSQLFCQLANASQSELNNLQASWAELNNSWQEVQWLKVGPILEHNRNFRIQLWPDSRGFVVRDVEKFLLTQTPLEADTVATSSVSGQGIPALEYLLFPSDAQNSLINADNKAKRCEVVMAISVNLVNISTDVYQQWQPAGGNYVQHVIEGTGEFTGIKDTVEELVTNWLEQVERVKDDKMLEPLGQSAPGLPKIAEFALSDKSIESVQLNVDSFERIYTAGNGHGFDKILTEFLEQDNIAAQMTDKIAAAKISVNALNGSYPDLLNSTEGRVDIEDAIAKLRELRDVLSIDFIQATDINVGFNSNDGD